MTLDDAPGVLTVAETARLTRRRPDDVRAALRTGELLGFRHGHGWRVHRGSVRAWVGLPAEAVTAGAVEPDAIAEVVKAAVRTGVREALAEMFGELARQVGGPEPP